MWQPKSVKKAKETVTDTVAKMADAVKVAMFAALLALGIALMALLRRA